MKLEIVCPILKACRILKYKMALKLKGSSQARLLKNNNMRIKRHSGAINIMFIESNTNCSANRKAFKEELILY